MTRATLNDLPVELLYEVQLRALSQSLPCVSRRIRQVFRSAPSSFLAEYLATLFQPVVADSPTIISRSLRFPFCTIEVIDSLCRILKRKDKSGFIELPKRLFRPVGPKPDNSVWSSHDHPLPFLRKLLAHPLIPALDANAHSGYGLTRAVHAKFTPLIQFLLDMGATPTYRDGLVMLVAIRTKDLALVKLLLERKSCQQLDFGGTQKRGKRRKLEDRMEITPEMLKIAVKCGARDVVEYFTQEKRVVPDMQTLKLMSWR